MNKSINLLLVEDNPGDVLLFQDALDDVGVNCNLDVIEDGIYLNDYLNRAGQYSNKKTPDLIILDINLPKKNGLDTLKEMKSDSRFKAIPVLMLTSSRDNADIQAAYDRHANSYFTKPSELAGYEDIVKAIEEYWVLTALLPEVKI